MQMVHCIQDAQPRKVVRNNATISNKINTLHNKFYNHYCLYLPCDEIRILKGGDDIV